MRILILTTIYPVALDDSPYLTSELADAWQRAGHEVDVLVLQWSRLSVPRVPSLVFPSGVRVHYFAPKNFERYGQLVERLLRWGLSSGSIRGEARAALGGKSHDFVFALSPLTSIRSLVKEFAGRNNAVSCAYITDFFPIAHRDLGLIPSGPIYTLAKHIETRLLNRFDAIGCMSPANVAFLRNHYAITQGQNIFVQHLWGEPPIDKMVNRSAIRARHHLPPDARLAVWGGQITEGRGLPELLEAARLARRQGSDIWFLILGDGRLRHLVEEAVAADDSNLIYMGHVPREDYLELASACDVGVIVTVAHTSVPTFPSKSIDYLRAGLPIVAATEAATDFGAFLEENRVGVSVLAGDAGSLLEAMQSNLDDAGWRDGVRERCHDVSRRVLNVDVAARSFLAYTLGGADPDHE